MLAEIRARHRRAAADPKRGRHRHHRQRPRLLRRPRRADAGGGHRRGRRARAASSRRTTSCPASSPTSSRCRSRSSPRSTASPPAAAWCWPRCATCASRRPPRASPPSSQARPGRRARHHLDPAAPGGPAARSICCGPATASTARPRTASAWSSTGRSPAELVDRACDYVRRIAASASPASVAETKRMVYRHLGVGYPEALREADRVQWAAVGRPDAAEGAQGAARAARAEVQAAGRERLKFGTAARGSQLRCQRARRIRPSGISRAASNRASMPAKSTGNLRCKVSRSPAR